MKARFVLVVMLLGLVVGTTPAVAREHSELTVFAAASLTDAFTEIGAAFTAAHPDVDVVFNFGGSSTLAAQLSEGAPADVFASANNKQMQVVVDAERVTSEPQTFARNQLVLIVPADNPAGIESLDDLANPGIKLVVAAPEVPVRVYTDAMLDALAADPAYGADFRDAVVANFVSEEDNVRQVAAKVALGEADAGVVYSSDVTPDIAEDVITLPIADAYNTLATYPIAPIADSANLEQAQVFVDFVLGDEGQDILVKWGLISVRPAPESTPEATAEATPEATAQS